VKNKAGSYGDIPWFQGNRADTVQLKDGADTIVVVKDREGKKLEFLDVEEYIKFWRKNTPIENQK